MKEITNNFSKLIISFFVFLIGILGSLAIKYFPLNNIGLMFLIILGIFRFGGLFLLIVYSYRFFAKEKKEVETLLEHMIIKKNKLLMYSIGTFVLGLFFCLSYFFVFYICNNSDRICSIRLVGLEVSFFIPVGIVMIIISIIKLYRYIKK